MLRTTLHRFCVDKGFNSSLVSYLRNCHTVCKVTIPLCIPICNQQCTRAHGALWFEDRQIGLQIAISRYDINFSITSALWLLWFLILIFFTLDLRSGFSFYEVQFTDYFFCGLGCVCVTKIFSLFYL